MARNMLWKDKLYLAWVWGDHSMRHLTGWAIAFLFSLAPAATAAAEPVAGSQMSTQATQWRGGVPAPKGRLKFKSAGAVCGCGEGMSERDIEQAMARSKPGKIAGPDSDASGSQAGGQEKNLNLGVTK